ncbi:nuclear pore complex protein Nup205 [Drosophila albomicans]|uniref:Nuclear pore complex protein Nup205 n=1 Tax=Drosophila albomicans TaxID=7291 RepID=A0A6P8XZT3_DROAB|nr:nuclear pore complex protein Nup205 [Drosophila albomicans]
MEGVVEDMWTPYKRLYNIFQLAITNPSDVTSDLELCLKKYKQNFTNFLRNPPKSEKSRTHLRNALTEGVLLAGQTHKVELSHELIDEAIIISDMFDLDEIFALELLCTAQRQQIHHPGLSRGLVAVLLYYDGRKAISCTLRDMFQAVSGVAWSTDLPREITGLINNYAQNLVDDSNILGRLLELIGDMNVEKEIGLLTKNRAFGSKKHQNQVLGLYEDTRKTIAMAMFNWSAQRGLPKNIAIRLLQYLANVKSTDSNGNLDDVTVILLMTLLYAYDTSVLLMTDCDSPYTARLPILCDGEYAKCFYEAIYAQSSWQTPQLDAIIKYSFGLTLASLRQAPSEVQTNVGAIINRDEQLIDEALVGNVFGFLYRNLLEKNICYSTEFIYRRLHVLITDFIDFMHAKVSELRGRADETARTMVSFLNEGLEPPPHLDVNFELLMLCVAKLYGDKRAVITLCNEYWGPTDSADQQTNTSRAISLFKFIRLASDLLPQTLFKSYLNMIAGLTRSEFSARCAFNLLKNSPNLSSSCAVSWDHFFNALNNYFNNMRTDFDVSLYNTSDSIYRGRSMPRNMTPRETEHMVAVMSVIQAVANHDEISRIMICDQTTWQTSQVLLGLVACTTPVVLKGEILFTLAALSKSKETARTIWFHLEESQIIPTLPPRQTQYPEFSLAEEIDQNESRMETYKLSRGILQLLYTLMTTHMPSSLGAGPRLPGFDPYLKFVLDSILLKFYNRAYKDPTEKWEVGAKCLKLMYYLLASYRPKVSDFMEQRDEHPYPGYHIMLQLHVKSDMLRLLLRIIEEARERLDDYNQFNGKELLEECALYALLLLEVALAKQNAFFEAHATANCSILLPGLNRMLLDLNPRTRAPDYVINIIKFVTYNSWLPRHTLAAIKILTAVTLLPDVITQILNMYAHGSNEKLEIRQRFVECLEMEVPRSQQTDENNVLSVANAHDEFDGNGQLNETDSQVDLMALEERKPQRIELQIKEAIVQLFELNLNQPLPNFVYFLLGIDVIRDFTASEKQQLGLDINCSCINSLVLLLERHLEQQRHSDAYCEHTAHIVERIYHLFHGLCVNRRTSEPILRYFRLTCNDFLVRHLSAMPFRQHGEDHVLHAMSHLMNCVCIEIKLAASYGQTTRYQLLSDILLAVNSDGQRNGGHCLPQEMGNNLLTPPNSSNYYGMYVLPTRVGLHNSSSLGLHANRLLDCLTLDTTSLSQPPLQFFDEPLIAKLLVDCEAPTCVGRAGMINVHKLHDILHDELRHVQSTIASGQRKAIIDEITLLLQHAIQLNCVRMRRYATYSFMTAWCRLVQILFGLMPDSLLPLSVRKQHMIDIIEKILMKVEPTQPLVKISIQVTDTVLNLLVNLRHCYYQLEDQRTLEEHASVVCLSDGTTANANPNSNGGDVSKTNSNNNSTSNSNNNNNNNNNNNISQKNGNQQSISAECNSSNLRFILKRLIDWIMTSEVKSQKMSINLYASLINCLRIVKRLRSDEQIEYNETLASTRWDVNKTYGNLQATHTDDVQQKEMAAEIIGSIGDKLIDTICHDAITGHDVCSMLALSSLNLISELRAISTLSDVVTTRGYLNHILESLAKLDHVLRDLLKPTPHNMRAQYVYESYMAFLAQMSQTHVGAHLVLSSKALGVLSNMSIYDMQPDLKASEVELRHQQDEFVPAIDARFRAILLPALALCDSVLDSLGDRNNSASLQVLNFMIAHIDMIESILRAASPFMNLGHLEQLAAITHLFARTTTHDVVSIQMDEQHNNDVDMCNRLSRLQQLMVVVFGRFTVNEPTIRRMLHPNQMDLSEEEKSQHVKYFLQIASNLSLYCRKAVTSGVKDGMSSQYLLTTMVSDVRPLSGSGDSKKLTVIMGTILNQLKGSIAYYLSQKSIADNLLQQRASLPNITFGPIGKQNFLELSQRHNEKRSELMISVFIGEQNLYLLWIHLDFYFRNAVIYSQENRNAINESSLDPENISVLNASPDEVTKLKQLLISTFNETFCTQLLDASEEYSMKCKNFNASLMRRIKALVQFAPQS